MDGHAMEYKFWKEVVNQASLKRKKHLMSLDFSIKSLICHSANLAHHFLMIQTTIQNGIHTFQNTKSRDHSR